MIASVGILVALKFCISNYITFILRIWRTIYYLIVLRLVLWVLWILVVVLTNFINLNQTLVRFDL